MRALRLELNFDVDDTRTDMTDVDVARLVGAVLKHVEGTDGASEVTLRSVMIVPPGRLPTLVDIHPPKTH